MIGQDYIKILVFEKRTMSREGLAQWGSKLRGSVKKIVFVPLPPTRYLPKEINTKDKLGEWLADRFGDGEFIIRGWTAGKTKTRVKFIRLAEIKIGKIKSPDVEDNFNFHFVSTKGISRYRFWKG